MGEARSGAGASRNNCGRRGRHGRVRPKAPAPAPAGRRARARGAAEETKDEDAPMADAPPARGATSRASRARP